MSGLEVVGVVLGVLGALPAAVEALKGYRSLLSSVRNVDRDLRTLIQDLETEQVRLRTTCEVLLDGVAPYSVVDSLIQSPFGPEWKPYKDQLRLRLWSSTPKFEEYVSEMEKASMELGDKLSIQKNGKTNLNDRVAILKELKRGASFTLKKKDFEDIVERIKTGNSILHDLVNQSCGLEPSRQKRSQARLIKLIRGLAKSVFQALQNANTCRCVRPHEVCLELVPRSVVIVPTDVEDEVAKNFVFNVAYGIHGSFLVNDTAAKPELSKPQKWENFELRLGEFSKAISSQTENRAMTAIPSGMPPSKKPPKRVAWSHSSTSVSRASKSVTTLAVKAISDTLVGLPVMLASSSHSLLSNLCQDLPRNQRAVAKPSKRYYITDSNRDFGLYPQHKDGDHRTAITLRQLLTEEGEKTRDFSCLQKLKVALAISTNILHLYKTPWLARMVTLDDFVFIINHRDVSLLSAPDALDKPFIAKTISHTANPDTRNNQPRPVNLTVLSLGVLLIQIIIGRAIEELDVTAPVDMDMNEVLSKYESGSRFSDQVLENGGPNYVTAVKWCLENVFGRANLEHETFCQTFYDEVIARLEEDVGYLEDQVY